MKRIVILAAMGAAFCMLPVLEASATVCQSITVISQPESAEPPSVEDILKLAAEKSGYSASYLTALQSAGELEINECEEGFRVKVGEGGGIDVIIFIEDLF